MGFLSDYFSAPSDEAAARAVGIDVDLREPPYDVLQMKNLIPDYHLVPVEVVPLSVSRQLLGASR